MKVLHVIDSAGLYGAEKMLLVLAINQRAMGLDVKIASIGSRACGEKQIEVAAKKLGLTCKSFRFRNGPNIFGAYDVVKYASEHKVDVIHTHGYKGNILLGLLPKIVRRIPRVVTLHGWMCRKKLSLICLYEWLDIYMLSNASAVVGVSREVISHKKIFEKQGLKCAVIQNGVNLVGLDGFDDTIEPGIEEFCSGSTIVCSIGRLSHEKGHKYLFQSIRKLLDDGLDVRLLLVGAGPEHETLKKLAIDLKLQDRIMFTGYKDNAQKYLNCIDVFVISSLTEGLPITLLEAMAAKVPIVATKVGGIPDTLNHGDGGILVDAADSQVLADAIKTICKDENVRRNMTKVSYSEVVATYSGRIMAGKYLTLYNDILNKP